MRIMIATDGQPHAKTAALFGVALAGAIRAEVVLLGVAKDKKREGRVRQELAALESALRDEGVDSIMTTMRYGSTDEEVLSETEQNPYDLVVIGTRGRRRLRRFLLGSIAKRLARHVRPPLLIVRDPAYEVKHILICTSGGEPGEKTTRVGGRLAAELGADVTVLHVMSQIPITPEAKVDDLERDTRELLQTDARESQHLKRDMAILEAQGVDEGRRQAVILRGLVLDEILKEAREGSYDLVVIGAHQVPSDLPWGELREMLQIDIADQVLTYIRRPVLVVHSVSGVV
jgi:nucleotide-binding universal stress UspA family protein